MGSVGRLIEQPVNGNQVIQKRKQTYGFFAGRPEDYRSHVVVVSCCLWWPKSSAQPPTTGDLLFVYLHLPGRLSTFHNGIVFLLKGTFSSSGLLHVVVVLVDWPCGCVWMSSGGICKCCLFTFGDGERRNLIHPLAKGWDLFYSVKRITMVTHTVVGYNSQTSSQQRWRGQQRYYSVGDEIRAPKKILLSMQEAMMSVSSIVLHCWAKEGPEVNRITTDSPRSPAAVVVVIVCGTISGISFDIVKTLFQGAIKEKRNGFKKRWIN